MDEKICFYGLSAGQGIQATKRAPLKNPKHWIIMEKTKL